MTEKRCWICKRNKEEILKDDYSGVAETYGEDKMFVTYGDVEFKNPIKICKVCWYIIELCAASMWQRDYENDFVEKEELNKLFNNIKI